MILGVVDLVQQRIEGGDVDWHSSQGSAQQTTMTDFFDLPRERRWRVYALLVGALIMAGLIIFAPWRGTVIIGLVAVLTGIAATRFALSSHVLLRFGHAGRGLLHLVLATGLGLVCITMIAKLLG